MWWQISGSTLAQVMACCLATPSHYLKQSWLVTSKVPGHLSEDIIIRRSEDKTFFKIQFLKLYSDLPMDNELTDLCKVTLNNMGKISQYQMTIKYKKLQVLYMGQAMELYLSFSLILPSISSAKPLPSRQQNFLCQLSQYHTCWCPGFLHCQGINRHHIVFVMSANSFLTLGWIWYPSKFCSQGVIQNAITYLHFV